MRGTTDARARRRAWIATTTALLLASSAGAASPADSDLGGMNIEDLLEVEVTSVSKRSQKVSEAPGAVTVLSGEDIRRSGARSIPEALRAVPGLHVAQIDANKWAITARGFNSQFANKLLVLIDGRSVYTPLFSGVFWDVQDVMLEDVDRIEVIRGPGGTLWGANAVNGVINIITKSADQTQGIAVSAGSGTLDKRFTDVRLGGALGDVSARGYIKYFDRNALESGGAPANDQWDALRGGFRMDWDVTEQDRITVQGDYYDGTANDRLLIPVLNRHLFSGGNVLTRWNHVGDDGSETQLQFYYDRTERDVTTLLDEERNTVDIELNHHFAPSKHHDLVVGGGYRMTSDDITSAAVTFAPTSVTEHLAQLFIQDEIAVVENLLSFTIGSKFEYNGYTGFEYQPSIRALLTPNPRHSFWGAISQAVRTPSRADRDLFVTAPSQDLPLTIDTYVGNPAFQSEELLAYEAGYRGQVLDTVSLDVATYYNDYRDLRSLESTAPPVPCGPFTCRSLTFGNQVNASAWGVETSATWIPTPWWQLQSGYTYMKLDVGTDPGSTDITSQNQEGDTPEHQFFLLSRMSLPWNFELDSSLYWVDRLKSQNVPSYTRFDVRVGWHATEHLEFSLVGQNLTSGRHMEFENGLFTLSTQVPRSVYGMVTWRH
ncbi:MAG: TonB-dependent receptor plug domain-containing protein [Longimicrobiales bacterium]